MANPLVENQETEGICLEIEKTPLLMQATSVTPSNNSRQEQFDEFLIQAVDEALSTLGEPVKNTFYQHLENDFCIPRNEIPKKIGEFSHIIHKIFGLCANRLEIKFMKNLNSRIKLDVKWPGYEYPLSKWIVLEVSFEEYISKMRQSYETQGSKTP
jgi:hypothetical protein